MAQKSYTSGGASVALQASDFWGNASHLVNLEVIGQT